MAIDNYIMNIIQLSQGVGNCYRVGAATKTGQTTGDPSFGTLWLRYMLALPHYAYIEANRETGLGFRV